MTGRTGGFVRAFTGADRWIGRPFASDARGRRFSDQQELWEAAVLDHPATRAQLCLAVLQHRFVAQILLPACQNFNKIIHISVNFQPI